MAEANLLVTFDPTHAGKAKEEVDKILEEVKEKAEYLKSEVDGLFQLKVKDAKKLVKNLVGFCKKNKKKFEVTFHWVPIDKWCKSTIEDMQKTIKGFVKDIKKTEKWKMDLVKRQYEKMHTTELILKLTEVVDRPKVDLKKPDKIIKVEVIGDKAGIALLAKDELLNVVKIKG